MTIEEAIKDIEENIKPSAGGISLDMAIEALKKQLPQKMIKIKNKSSQACPICNHNVNWNYCSNCGQRIKY